MDKPRVLAVGAHPDDLEILCGGTLAQYAASGHVVVMAHMLNGDKGHYKTDSATLAKIRQKEAEAAGALIGSEVIGLDLPDAELIPELSTRKMVVNLIRRARPDIIITHDPNDYISDHTATSQIVCDASFYSAAPLFETPEKAHDKVTPIFFMDTLAGMGFLPVEYVDISQTFERKMDMLKQHESQLDWLMEHHGLDMTRFVEITARFRGLQCGVEFAEGFRQYDVWPRKTTTRLLP